MLVVTVGLSMTTDDDVAIPRALRSRLRREIDRMIKAAARSELVDDLDVVLHLCGDAAYGVLDADDAATLRSAAVLVRVQRPAVFGEQGPAGEIWIHVANANRSSTYGLHAEMLRLASWGMCRLLGFEANSDAAERSLANRAAVLRREATRDGRVRAPWSTQSRRGQ